MSMRPSLATLTGVLAGLLVHALAVADPAAPQHPASGPTAESALAAEEQLARAMRDNDPDGIAHMLVDDWAVITAHGGVGEGKDIFPSGIRSGALKRTSYEISEPRVRVYGDTAVVTVKVALSGVFSGKPFNVVERVTDVFAWKDGAWKAILTHETFIPEKAAA
jgi:ketosteroid isomerase-like protein